MTRSSLITALVLLMGLLDPTPGVSGGRDMVIGLSGIPRKNS